MTQRKYNSFKEIDEDLKILRLKKEIAIWSARNDYQRLQNSFSIRKLALSMFSNVVSSKYNSSWMKILWNVLFGYLIKRVIKR